MELLERNVKQKIVLTTMLLVGLAALAVLIIWLIAGSAKLHGPVSVTTAYRASVGPVSLFQINKSPLSGGGFEAAIQFLPGLWLYAAVWAVIAADVSAVRIHTART